MADRWTIPTLAFPRLPSGGSVAIEETVGRSVAMVVARAGQEGALRSVVVARHGISLPDGPRYAAAPGIAFLGMGPGKWLAHSDAAETFAPLAGHAAVVDQSGAYGILRVSGANADRLLGRAVAIDCDPPSFPAGSVATTIIEHIGVTIARVGDTVPTYELYVVRSFAGGLAYWLNRAFGTRLSPMS